MLISIIVPCYNQAHFLDECLQSVINQTYKHWECIIVNDGSPDLTEKVSSKWIKQDSRIKYIYKENGGLSSARNAGIEIAKGEWILPLDADDIISPSYLYLASKKFNNHYDLIYCNAKLFGSVNSDWILKDYSLENLALHNIIFCSSFFRKDSWLRIGGYDENLRSGLEDWDFWISLLKNGGAVYKIPDVCFYYRIKEISMAINLNNSLNKDYTLKYIYKKHSDFFIENLETFEKYISYKEELIRITKSKRYRFINKILSILKK